MSYLQILSNNAELALVCPLHGPSHSHNVSNVQQSLQVSANTPKWLPIFCAWPACRGLTYGHWHMMHAESGMLVPLVDEDCQRDRHLHACSLLHALLHDDQQSNESHTKTNESVSLAA